MRHLLSKMALPAVLALLLLHQGAWARCDADSSETTTVNVMSGSAQGSGKLMVPREAPVGTTVWASPIITMPPVYVDCRYSGQTYGVHMTGLTRSGLANVFRTDIPYLGVKVVEITSFTAVDWHATRWITPAYNFKGSLSPSYQVSLVVIAPVTGGGHSSNMSEPIARDYISESPHYLHDERELHRLRLGDFETQVTGATPCTTSNVTVNLGNHRASAFGAVGSTTAAADFTIELRNCPAGMRRITYQIDPATPVVPGTGNSVVALNAASTATGVGVQLLDAAGAPLALASQRTVGASGGTYTIPLKARYYKTAPTVGGGSANSAMTFTISYN